MGHDDTTPRGTPAIRSRGQAGMWMPLGAVAAAALSFGIFLFQRTDGVRSDLAAEMKAGRQARDAQVSALERDVVRLQDQQANTAVLMAEIKADMREIISTLNEMKHGARTP